MKTLGGTHLWTDSLNFSSSKNCSMRNTSSLLRDDILVRGDKPDNLPRRENRSQEITEDETQKLVRIKQLQISEPAESEFGDAVKRRGQRISDGRRKSRGSLDFREFLLPWTHSERKAITTGREKGWNRWLIRACKLILFTSTIGRNLCLAENSPKYNIYWCMPMWNEIKELMP